MPGARGAEATVVGSLPALGTPKLTVKSGDASVHYCATNSTQAPVVGTFAGTDCATASVNLTSFLGVYNPGWTTPIDGSSWIGPTTGQVDGANPGGAPSSDYAAAFGSYEFVAKFTIPPGVTSTALQFSGMADNAMVVYLNGVKIGQHTFLQDCTTAQAATTPPTCNWNLPLLMNNSPATLNVGADNFLRVDLVGTSIGLITDGVSTATSACSPFPPLGPQTAGFVGFAINVPPTVATFPNHAVGGNAWSTTTCLNPTGLDFVANVFWTVPVVTTWCSPGFWKEHPTSPPWPSALLNDPVLSLYNHYSGLYARAPQSIAGNPTLLTVVSNPSIYKGPATNNVADVISHVVFGTPIINAEIESCPDPSAF
jgi:hypothetical protein